MEAPGEERTLTRRSVIQAALGLTALTCSRTGEGQTPPVTPVSKPSRVKFRKVVINASSDFEAASAADINGDGRLDIVSGDTWYEAPNWTPHKFREIGVWGRSATESGYRADFADLPIDVNGDGKIDIVSSDYASGTIFWHENIGKSSDLWPRHEIAKPGSAETTILAPILKNKVCILPNCGGSVVWYELRTASATPEWVEHVVGKEGAGHGVGWGDVNGDGKVDIITPNGWYEQIDALNDRWIWRPDFHSSLSAPGIGMPVYDVNGDGLNDIVMGSGHNYGLAWMQQMPAGSPQKWVEHLIDTTWSQAHALMLADIEHNRRPVVLTGKRYKAHDHDPGADQPLGIYYYKYSSKENQWTKYVIDEGTHAGTGLQLWVADLRNKGRLDIIAPGKSGLYLFENEGV